MTRGRVARGFSLVELLIAVMLGSMLMMGLGSIFATTFRAQSGEFRREINQDSVLAGYRSITRDVGNATSMSLPAFGGSGDTLRGCTNYTVFPAASGGLRISNAVAVRHFNYCVNAAGIMFFTFRDFALGTGTCPAAAVACNATYPGGTMIQIGRGLARAERVTGPGTSVPINNECGNQNYFCRSAARPRNVVQIHFQVDRSTAASIVSTDVTMDAAANDQSL